MRLRFLTMAVALAGLFASQQAFAKNHTKTPKTANKTASANKKHHKKHMKKASVAAPATQATPALS